MHWWMLIFLEISETNIFFINSRSSNPKPLKLLQNSKTKISAPTKHKFSLGMSLKKYLWIQIKPQCPYGFKLSFSLSWRFHAYFWKTIYSTQWKLRQISLFLMKRLWWNYPDFDISQNLNAWLLNRLIKRKVGRS